MPLRDLVNEGWFSVQELNRWIDKFVYSVEDRRDKPATQKEALTKISGCACQIWTFIRFLPLLVADRIKDPCNDSWKFILLMREIVMLTCVSKFKKTCLPYFELIILQYLDLRYSLYPEVPLRPKHHFLQH